MARKLTILKVSGAGTTAVVHLGTDEAGGTVNKPDVAEMKIDLDYYASLTAGEKTAFRAGTLGDIIDAVVNTLTEI